MLNPTLPQLLRRLWVHITPLRRGQLGLLFVVMILASFAEVVSIGAVVPFLGVFLLTAVYAVAICLFFEIARQGLKVSRLNAVGVVVFDFIFSISLMSILGSIKSQI